MLEVLNDNDLIAYLLAFLDFREVHRQLRVSHRMHDHLLDSLQQERVIRSHDCEGLMEILRCCSKVTAIIEPVGLFYFF